MDIDKIKPASIIGVLLNFFAGENPYDDVVKEIKETSVKQALIQDSKRLWG